MEHRKILVYGIGAVGGFFGAKLAKAAEDEDFDVYFVARGKTLEAIRKRGLLFHDRDGTTEAVWPKEASDDIGTLPVPEVVLLCVKGYDLDGALASLAGRVTGDTVVIPILNGLDIYDRVRDGLPKGIVLPSCLYVSVRADGPGEITHAAGDPVFITGPDPGNTDFDELPLIRLFKKAGLPLQWTDERFRAIWEKFIFIAPFGLVTAATGKTMGAVLADDASKRELVGIMKEIESLAKAKGIVLPSDVIDVALDKGRSFPFDTKTSFQRDVETPGRRNEGDQFGGAIIKMGASLRVPTPVTREVYNRIIGS